MPQERMTLEQYRREMGMEPVKSASRTKKSRTDESVIISESKNAPEGKQRASKYGAKKTWYMGICFDSNGEAVYYAELLLRMMSGEVTGIGRQVEFILQDGEDTVIKYKADFVVWFQDGRAEVHEFKGMELPGWKLKEKLFRARFPRIKLIVVK